MYPISDQMLGDSVGALLLLCGIVYAVTAMMRRAWHPDRQAPEPTPRLRWADVWPVLRGLLLGLAIFFGACVLGGLLPPP